MKKLKKVTIANLKPGIIEQNTILWVKTISPPSQLSSVMVVVEDNLMTLDELDRKCVYLDMNN